VSDLPKGLMYREGFIGADDERRLWERSSSSTSALSITFRTLRRR
jgi:hypothetical protein